MKLKILSLLLIATNILCSSGVAFAADIGQSFQLENISKSDTRLKELFSNPNSDADFILIDFWASWCGTCSRTLPFFASIKSKYPNLKIRTVAVNLDTDSEKANKFISRIDTADLGIYFDPKADLAKAYDIKSMPTTILMDKNGKVISIFEDFSEEGLNKIESSLKNLSSL